MQHEQIVYIGYTGGVGGEAMQMFELAAAVATSGRPTTVIVPELEGLARFVAGYAQRSHLTVRTTPLIRFDTGAQNPLDVLRLLLPYRNAGILHLHTGDICLPRLTLAALELLRPRHTVATIHSAEMDMLPDSPRARYWKRVVNGQLRQVICPSAHGKRTQLGYGLLPDRTTTIYNGVDVARFATGNPEGARSILGIGPETPLVLFASRFHPQKRPLDAVAAFGKLAKVRSDVHFALVGTGPLEAEVRAAVAALSVGKERVHLVGHQSNIPDWLAAATVFLLPTHRENFSLALIEALAAGCPVVSTYCQGNDEILQPGVNALTAMVSDVDRLAYWLLRVIEDSGLQKRLADAGRETAARFTRERMTEQYLALYATINPRLG